MLLRISGQLFYMGQQMAQNVEKRKNLIGEYFIEKYIDICVGK